MDNSDDNGRWLFLGLVLGAAIFAIANGLSCSTPQCSAYWLGSGGIVGLFTVFAAVGGAYMALRTFRLNMGIGRATRFQKGAEMLGDANFPVQVGGIQVLRTVAIEDPRNYLVPTVKALAVFAEEAEAEVRAVYDPWVSGKPPTDFPWPVSGFPAAEAMSTIASLCPDDGLWPHTELTFEGRLQVAHVYINDKIFTGDRFCRLDLTRWVVNSVEFRNCDFTGSKIKFAVGVSIRFVECTMTDCIVEFRDQGAKLPGGVWDEAIVELRDCKVEGATCNGMPMSEWIAFSGPRLVY